MNEKDVNNWKQLDLTAKYAQLNSLRKIASDISFTGITVQLQRMIEIRIQNLTEDLIQLDHLDRSDTLLNVESVGVAIVL